MTNANQCVFGKECSNLKSIKMSREARLWAGLVIIPAASMIISLITTPEVKEEIARKGISFLGKWL